MKAIFQQIIAAIINFLYRIIDKEAERVNKSNNRYLAHANKGGEILEVNNMSNVSRNKVIYVK